MAEESRALSYYESLSPEELRDEITREEELLTGLRDQLSEAIARRDETREAMDKEGLIRDLEALRRSREERITRLRTEIVRLQGKISAERRRVGLLTPRIRTLEADLPVPATRSNYFRLMRRIRDIRTALRRYPPLSVVTRAYYHKHLEDYLRWMRAIRELRILYRRLGGYRSAIVRWQDTVTSLRKSIAQYERWQRVRVETIERVTRLRGELLDWISEVNSLQARVTLLETELEKKRSVLPPLLLCRIKIRLYNMERRPTPTGMFQGFFEIDAIIDPETEMPDWTWWLTVRELQIAKYHMVQYFKGMAKWHPPEQLGLGYFTGEGIPYKDERVSYKRKMRTGEPFVKNVPRDFITKAERLTVEELIVGESSKAPVPNPDPRMDNMGVYFEDAYIINADGVIKWHERRDKWIRPPPTAEQVKKVRDEIGL